jgi:chromosome partitioning protein
MTKIVVLAQQKGGSGKTTLAAQLAAAWRAEGRSVALVDLDPQRSLSRWANLRGDAGVRLIESKDWRAGGDIRGAARTADRVLVDCPGNAESLLRTALREASLVVLPCQPTPLDAWATGAMLDLCRKEKARARVALNRVPPRGGAVDEALALLAGAGAQLLHARLGARVAFSNAFLTGRSAAEMQPRSLAAAEALALAAEVEALLA